MPLYEVIIMFNKIKKFFDNEIVLMIVLAILFILIAVVSGVTGEIYGV